MKNKRKRRGVGMLIAILAAALIAVIAVIAWKQWEYRESTSFYDGLRGAMGTEVTAG